MRAGCCGGGEPPPPHVRWVHEAYVGRSRAHLAMRKPGFAADDARAATALCCRAASGWEALAAAEDERGDAAAAALAREGWHYAPAPPAAAAAEAAAARASTPPPPALAYNGVVYNERRGALVSADAQLSRAARRALFPDVAYRFDAAGEPREIPTLTADALRDYHERYYHPSNARL